MTLLFFNFGSMDKKPVIRYVALGDSYTIGTGTSFENSWPTLLIKHLKENKIDIVLAANPSHNGWTTQDLINKELPILDVSKPGFVTLLIGVNDWVQGVSPQMFQRNLILILDHIQSKLEDKSKIVLITIPDFGVTPTGAKYSGGRSISKGISDFNTIIEDEAKKRNLKTVDLYMISKEMGKDASLVADDGLHPSAKEYAIWESMIYPVVYKELK